MYVRLLAIDLRTATRLAAARNLDIRQARQRVQAARGRYESNVEAVFPVIAPSIALQHLEGVNQNANGTLTLANFTNFLPALSVQWILNPGRVVYDIIASKRRLEASDRQEEAAVLETMRAAALQYYELVLAQQQIAVASRAEAEAEELLRIESLKLNTGTGLPADELRAGAAVAAVQQDLTIAVNHFYQSSLALALTLHLDPAVTLVPASGQLGQMTLVREDLAIDQMLAAAVRYRPDLQAVRLALGAAQADRGAVVWGDLGPQFQAAYTFGGLETHITGHTYHLSEQQKAGGSAGFALGFSTFGQVKTARANEKLAAIDVTRQVDQVRAGVISAQQSSISAAKLIPVAARQVEAAEEALRLTQTNLKAGLMLTLDVLQAQDATDQARLRYATALVHYNQSQVNLLASMGLLDERTLYPSNASAAGPETRSTR